jgi:hypothetical protein
VTLIRVDHVFQPLPVPMRRNVPTLIRRMGLVAILLAVIVMALIPTQSFGMELKVAGTQLILSGPVVGDEPGKVREALASSPSIETVILRNSGGGNAPPGYQVGQLLRERGLRTAVSGYCYSSCSRMSLGGSTRYFTDDYIPEYNNVGFHGHYDRMGRLNANLVRQYGLRIGSSNTAMAKPTLHW